MEHIVQFGIGIDDQFIKERIEARAEDEIMKELTLDIKRVIFQTEYYRRDEFTKNPSDFIERKIDTLLDKHKDKIISMAADRLAERLAKTKKAKEMLEKTINNY